MLFKTRPRVPAVMDGYHHRGGDESSPTVLVLARSGGARRNPHGLGAGHARLPAEVLDWSGSEGHVFTHGERWQAHGTEILAPGETVEVADIRI